ncbi:hypothetical protein [Streptomyces sp. NE06-03C]|uniref:hypothetical protein n=1 Tax=Streptomyces sp. NE06-03C TaxID=3028694 RepID=UPI0029B2C6B3|nr:hypothetical protein [Streptomyces sp. NE06-03C]MDX2922891.1 hypothetical protein [Streptomyces sp. NE06-03C]
MSSYPVPALTRAEVSAARDRDPRPADCPTCPNYPVPHWPAQSGCTSSFRRDAEGVERLFRVHCTCGLCW